MREDTTVMLADAHGPRSRLRDPISDDSLVPFHQLDSAEVARRAHGERSYSRDPPVDECHLRALTGFPDGEGPRLTDLDTHNRRTHHLGAGSVVTQRAGEHGTCPRCQHNQGLRTDRPQSRDYNTRRHTVQSPQSDGTSRAFDDSDKENRDPLRRKARNARTSSRQ